MAAWDIMQENSIVSLPIRDKEGALEGLITIGDIAKTYMDTTDSYLLSRARTQYQKIAETIHGEIIEEILMDILSRDELWWEPRTRIK